jgi:hypothetical protein
MTTLAKEVKNKLRRNCGQLCKKKIDKIVVYYGSRRIGCMTLLPVVNLTKYFFINNCLRLGIKCPF